MEHSERRGKLSTKKTNLSAKTQPNLRKLA